MGATTFFLLEQQKAREAKESEPGESPRVSWRLNPVGGGWYEILRDNEVVDKVRGADIAEDRLLELRGE